MIKMLYLHILQADYTENWIAFYKLIVLDNYKISKKSKESVLRYIENITGSVGNFVKCMCPKEKFLISSISSLNKRFKVDFHALVSLKNLIMRACQELEQHVI